VSKLHNPQTSLLGVRFLKGTLREIAPRFGKVGVLRFSGIFWVLAENGFHRRMNVPEMKELERFL